MAERILDRIKFWLELRKWERQKRKEGFPEEWLIKKGYIVARKLYLTMDDLYQDILDEYKGNPNWAGDD